MFYRTLTIPQQIVLKACRLYNIFGSGANHAIHAQFIAQASIFNDGHKIGLLHGALQHGSMHQLLRLKRAMKAKQSMVLHLNL